ncbi:MAG: ABC transporter ATP-binding protein [Streptococcaceae bacterium]|nr:ABC transporter ATP-binding protein [Streptococcaceae bacterium]
MSLLELKNLSIEYATPGEAPFKAVNDINISLKKGEFVGLVGESGSGKSTLGFAITMLQKAPARIGAGQILFDGVDIAHMTEEQLREQRSGGFAMVLQSGMNALNPVRTIEKHFNDIYEAHKHVDKNDYYSHSLELIKKVGLPESTLKSYPGELSGGMRQRVAIALALSLNPRLMVFDEPTTALDVMVQHEVMDTIRSLQKSEGFTAILISHDLGIVLESTSRVLVMHNGSIVEDASAFDISHHAKDNYTQMLLSHYGDPRAEEVSIPGLERGKISKEITDEEVKLGTITVNDISKVYPHHKRGEKDVIATSHVSFTLKPGESLGLVGASGSGKSTIAKMITGVECPTEGMITLGNKRIDQMKSGHELKKLRSDIQMVFQDPYAALNPLHNVEYVIMRPILNYTDLRGEAVTNRINELLEFVGLTPVELFKTKLPHQLSGGQRQRVVIARALASNPKIIIADEPVSMLDMTLRAGILALLDSLRVRFNVSMLYITHDLLSARLITDKIMVLHNGIVVESGVTADVLRYPQDDYTVKLLNSIPQLPEG